MLSFVKSIIQKLKRKILKNNLLIKIKLSVSNEEWWRCIPRIVINQFGVGCLEITWDKVNSQYMHMISHYKIFLNKVSYRRNIAPNVNRVVAKGLASSRSYEITVMVYPKDKTLLPQQSNVVVR